MYVGDIGIDPGGVLSGSEVMAGFFVHTFCWGDNNGNVGAVVQYVRRAWINSRRKIVIGERNSKLSRRDCAANGTYYK